MRAQASKSKSLEKETRSALLDSIRRWAEEELEVTLGELQANLLLDYILEEVGPTIYNAAIQDARAYFFDRLDDLEGSCYQPELPYWPERDRRS